MEVGGRTNQETESRSQSIENSSSICRHERSEKFRDNKNYGKNTTIDWYNKKYEKPKNLCALCVLGLRSRHGSTATIHGCVCG